MSVRLRHFVDLDPATAYDLWRLRQNVFIVEQNCPYADLDGRDTEPGTRHAWLEVEGTVAGTLRVLDDADAWRIGRVLVDPSVRGRGLANNLMDAVLPELSDRPIVLDAQSPLAPWYATFGFEINGPEFLEDGILHLPMCHP